MFITTPPFEAVENKMTCVGSGLSVSQRKTSVSRTVTQLLLTWPLYTAASDLRDLICDLRGERSLHLTREELTQLAQSLDKLVLKCESLIATSEEMHFLPWICALRRLAQRTEEMDSLAESFRLSASPEFAAHVEDLVKSATVVHQKEDDWRDFVASLQD